MRKVSVLLLILLMAMSITWANAQDGTPGGEAGDTPGAEEPLPAAIDVVKSVSIDGGATWDDAQIPTGPVVDVGQPVSFMIEVFNSGGFPLTNITLADSGFDTSGCVIPAELAVEASFSCVLGPVNAVEGQQRNVATVTATYETTLVTDADAAHYYAGTLVALKVEKSVSVNGGAWNTADTAPGQSAREGQQVSFRIVASNEGTETLTNVVLTDSMYDTSGCAVPATLAPSEGFECVLGPFEVPSVGTSTTSGGNNDDDGGDSSQTFVNTATVTAVAGTETVSVSDSAYYTVKEKDDDKVIIIIEGPITEIRNNIIIIFDMEIQIKPDDPILKVIRIGDTIRIEGEVDDSDVTHVIIIAIIVIIIDIDIYIEDNLIYRDDGDCGNPPPPWAPAHGWRRKCQQTIIERNRGGGRSSRRDDDD